jgi:alpha,alpha-trehalase
MKSAWPLLLSLALLSCAHRKSESHVPSAWPIDVPKELPRLLHEADSNRDLKITVRDNSPPFLLSDTKGISHQVAGAYRLSVLLQELSLAQMQGKKTMEFDPALLEENPLDRTSRLIGALYWDGLTHRLDELGLETSLADSKTKHLGSGAYLYVPAQDQFAWNYYSEIKRRRPELNLERVPQNPGAKFLKSIEKKQGMLSLKVGKDQRGNPSPLPYVVPGGRFNEMYGWDSYFIVRGLLLDGKESLAQAMVENQAYEIEQYGKILNANRTYYLTRTQPPFFTSMLRETYAKGTHDREWLKQNLLSAVDEYRRVWMSTPRITDTGLSRYYDEGDGPGPEVEDGAYDAMLLPFAKKAGLSPREYLAGVETGKIKNESVKRIFKHDRTVRETGHDTTYRFHMRSADFVSVDLNSLLFRYEKDIAKILRDEFSGSLAGVGNAKEWEEKAAARRTLMMALLWDEKEGFFFDYDVKNKKRSDYVSATGLYPLWAGIVTPKQAERLVKFMRENLEEKGGLSATAERSRGPLHLPDRPQRQWDFPYGWPPHQIMAWDGLIAYGFREDAVRLATKWLRMIASNARDFNGAVTEKYDVVKASHEAFAEYGNQGADFSYITKEGFGWTNASYRVGFELLNDSERNLLREELRRP